MSPVRTAITPNPTTLTEQCAEHLRELHALGYSGRTIEDREYELKRFCRWAALRRLRSGAHLMRAHLDDYRRHLAELLTRNGTALSADSIRVRLVAICTFCRWLVKTGILSTDATTGFERPIIGRRLPRAVLSHREVEQVLRMPRLESRTGLRDRAIMEAFYSTGIRRQELIQLMLTDFDADRGMISIRAGKGGKDRLVPIGQRAVEWVERYLAEVRVSWSDNSTAHHQLFLSNRGGPLNRKTLTAQIARYVQQALPEKRGACHLFRHSMATALLDHGADIRCVQEMLGHASLQTTQIYTHVSIRRLKEVHTRTHPARATKSDKKVDPPEEILP